MEKEAIIVLATTTVILAGIFGLFIYGVNKNKKQEKKRHKPTFSRSIIKEETIYID